MNSGRMISVGAFIAAFLIASFSTTRADARTVCKGSGSSAKCYSVKAKKKFAKRSEEQLPARAAQHGYGSRGTVGELPSTWMAFGIPEVIVQAPRFPTTTMKVASTRQPSGFSLTAAGTS